MVLWVSLGNNHYQPNKCFFAQLEPCIHVNWRRKSIFSALAAFFFLVFSFFFLFLLLKWSFENYSVQLKLAQVKNQKIRKSENPNRQNERSTDSQTYATSKRIRYRLGNWAAFVPDLDSGFWMMWLQNQYHRRANGIKCILFLARMRFSNPSRLNSTKFAPSCCACARTVWIYFCFPFDYLFVCLFARFLVCDKRKCASANEDEQSSTSNANQLLGIQLICYIKQEKIVDSFRKSSWFISKGSQVLCLK